MTVNELIGKLQSAFSLFTPQMAQAWLPIYLAALRGYEGPRLEKAYSVTMQEFEPSARKGWPGPKDFLVALPSTHPKIAAEGPRLDFAARGERVRKLMAEWREAQGNRAAGNNRDIMRALEFTVEPLANLWGWSETPRPIRLTRQQVRIVQQRAISQERVRLFGPFGKNGAEWWEQIESICQTWNISAVYDEWASKKREAA
jgi:hypothetical protein